jgi:hypothetical protein
MINSISLFSNKPDTNIFYHVVCAYSCWFVQLF